MSTYIEILSIQSPFPLGSTDDNNRVIYSTNFTARASAPVNQLEEEIAQVLVDASLGVLGTSIFVGPAANIPDASDVDPVVHINNTGGLSPTEAHDDSKVERHSFQMTVRSTSYKTARTRALAVWRELDGLRNTVVTAA